MKKDAYIVFGEWEEDLNDLTNDEIADLVRAFFAYVRRGEVPSKEAFPDRMVRSCWRKVQQAEDRADQAYEEKCEKLRVNGRKGGAPKGNSNALKQPKTTKNNQMVEKTTKTSLPDPDPDQDIRLSVPPSATDNQERKYSDMHYDKLQQLYSKFGEKG